VIYSIGVTGSRLGPFNNQLSTLRIFLEAIQAYVKKHTYSEDPSIINFHHGSCIGVDAAAHQLALNLDFFIHIHPSDLISAQSPTWLTCPKDQFKLYPMEHPLVRNQEIVNPSNILFALPKEISEQRIGGTWRTVQYARGNYIPVAIIWPDRSPTLQGKSDIIKFLRAVAQKEKL
jgi:hypothetical protein